jgi:hypothetical protein
MHGGDGDAGWPRKANPAGDDGVATYSTPRARQHVEALLDRLDAATPACAQMTFAASGPCWVRLTGGGFCAEWRP